jgi:hypothetical protein
MNQQTDETLSTGTGSDTASTLHSDSSINEHGIVPCQCHILPSLLTRSAARGNYAIVMISIGEDRL